MFSLIFFLVSSNSVQRVLRLQYIRDDTAENQFIHNVKCQGMLTRKIVFFLPSQIYHFQGCIIPRMKLKCSQIILQYGLFFVAFIIIAITTIKIIVLILKPNRYSTEVNVLPTIINGIWKSTVKPNLSFDYGNVIFKVRARFFPRQNHQCGMRRSSIPDSRIFFIIDIQYRWITLGLMTCPNVR